MDTDTDNLLTEGVEEEEAEGAVAVAEAGEEGAEAVGEAGGEAGGEAEAQAEAQAEAVSEVAIMTMPFEIVVYMTRGCESVYEIRSTSVDIYHCISHFPIHHHPSVTTSLVTRQLL